MVNSIKETCYDMLTDCATTLALRCRIKQSAEMRQVLDKRLQQLRTAQTLADLMDSRQMTGEPDKKGNFHELVGDRQGQIACALHGGSRLVFVPNNPLTAHTNNSDINAIAPILLGQNETSAELSSGLNVHPRYL